MTHIEQNEIPSEILDELQRRGYEGPIPVMTALLLESALQKIADK
jgi:hypothetical protein